MIKEIGENIESFLNKKIIKIKGYEELFTLHGVFRSISWDSTEMRFLSYPKKDYYVFITISDQELIAANNMLRTLNHYIEMPNLTCLEKIIYDID